MRATGLKTLTAGVVVFAVSVVAAAVLAAALTTAPVYATVAKGIADPLLTQPGGQMDQATQDKALGEMQTSLRASYVRFVVYWANAEPSQAGVYDETYLAGVEHAVTQANSDGLKVIITFTAVPKWASDSTFWNDNPYTVKGYDPRYAMKTNAATLTDFQDFCAHIAAQFQGKVWGYECWNEPNLQLTLYPQATADDPNFGAHVYIDMLRAFSTGIRQSDFVAKRIAGATAPWGTKASDPLVSRRFTTSPQRFAAQIKAAHVDPLFDGYSHHPYTLGTDYATNGSPETAPKNPGTTVNLRNLGTLLAVFPAKPFYLTEYGYQTAACASFSGRFVNMTKQADYLRRAYAYAARYPQVKMMLWFLLDDYVPPMGSDPYQGFYTGLRDSGVKKPAWYVFAGGTHLTMTAPTSAVSGNTIILTGKLSSAADGALPHVQLVIQSHVAGKPWATLMSLKTSSSGVYTAKVRPRRSTYYRATWQSVVTSASRRVAVH